MGNKLYVGNLPYSVRDNDLQQAFGAFGQVASAKVMMERDTGRSKGFGFVEYEDEALNEKAIDELNGKELDGRTINVSLARPKEDRPKRDFGGNDRGGNGGGDHRGADDIQGGV